MYRRLAFLIGAMFWGGEEPEKPPEEERPQKEAEEEDFLAEDDDEKVAVPPVDPDIVALEEEAAPEVAPVGVLKVEHLKKFAEHPVSACCSMDKTHHALTCQYFMLFAGVVCLLFTCASAMVSLDAFFVSNLLVPSAGLMNPVTAP